MLRSSESIEPVWLSVSEGTWICVGQKKWVSLVLFRTEVPFPVGLGVLGDDPVVEDVEHSFGH